MSQAIKHWPNTTPNAHLLPSSLFTEVIAATHGVYNKVNTKKDSYYYYRYGYDKYGDYAEAYINPQEAE